jgi:hypothetical protein
MCELLIGGPLYRYAVFTLSFPETAYVMGVTGKFHFFEITPVRGGFPAR